MHVFYSEYNAHALRHLQKEVFIVQGTWPHPHILPTTVHDHGFPFPQSTTRKHAVWQLCGSIHWYQYTELHNEGCSTQIYNNIFIDDYYIVAGRILNTATNTQISIMRDVVCKNKAKYFILTTIIFLWQGKNI
jgi:hypothetical protein